MVADQMTELGRILFQVDVHRRFARSQPVENELDTDPLEIPTAAACDTMKELIDLVEENL